MEFRRVALPAVLGVAVLTAPGQADPATVPSDSTEPYAVRAIVRPLREIGHVRATSRFCSDFASGAVPAARAALDYEARLVLAAADLRAFDASDQLAKSRTLATLEDDLRVLAEQSSRGRTELADLRAHAATGDGAADAAVVAFADALDGAKGRELELTRRLAEVVGGLAERPVRSIVDGPSDDALHQVFGAGAPSNRLPAVGFTSLRGVGRANDVDPLAEVAAERLFALPADALIGRDLARAGEHARVALALERCLP